jgi:hypothetical protein
MRQSLGLKPTLAAQVPPHIAEKWKQACKGKGSGGSADEADESGKQVLGKIKIITGGPHVRPLLKSWC